MASPISNIPLLPERIVLDFGPLSIPGLIRLGRSTARSAKPDLEPHTHRQLMEICLLAAGRQVFEIDRQRFDLSGGELLVSQPYTVHSSAGLPMERSTLYWLQLDVAASGFLDLPGVEHREILRRLRELGNVTFPGAGRLNPELDTIFPAWFGSDTLRRTRIKNSVMRFLLGVLDISGGAAEKQLSPEIMQAMSAVQENLNSNLRLEDLAQRAGLSLSRFKQRFSNEVGVPPREYVIRQKIHASQELLKTSSMGITQIAHRLGFASSQYFATTFRRYCGKSPSGFRRL